ncbi:hypothetical protein JY493_26205 [Serratia marcescens]|nr:hypothetical protein [Serratia marcescens]
MLTAAMVVIGLLTARDMCAAELIASVRTLTLGGLLAATLLALRYQWVGKGHLAMNLLRLALGLWVIAGVAALLS